MRLESISQGIKQMGLCLAMAALLLSSDCYAFGQKVKEASPIQVQVTKKFSFLASEGSPYFYNEKSSPGTRCFIIESELASLSSGRVAVSDGEYLNSDTDVVDGLFEVAVVYIHSQFTSI